MSDTTKKKKAELPQYTGQPAWIRKMKQQPSPHRGAYPEEPGRSRRARIDGEGFVLARPVVVQSARALITGSGGVQADAADPSE